ncbi:hypothetical protein Acr_05g0012600 [Actinidia rufa]|uniref:Uncharacterized protein n=1 Tax=Actinidia rufa TaxID=165716 RepID=A0A7J0EMB4_9ERIC|nr:hypothetical protein Acr_05g0012600 [Actinidia rufa]
MEGSPEANPLIAIHPSVEKKTNIMTLEELNALRNTYSFPLGVRIRLPDEGETITFTRPGEVAFYEAAFSAGLCFPFTPPLSWLYFKARNKKVLLGGYPSNVKGWKSKFFFVSGDEWEIPEGTSQEGAPRVPRTWGIPDKHYNNPPRLYGDELKVFEEIFWSVEKSGRFSVPVLLDSKSYRRVFVSLGSRAFRMIGDNLPSGDAPSSSSDVELSRLLPHIPDLTLLRWSGGKVLDPILDCFMNALSSSSNPSSESCSDSSLPVELESDAMSKRISFKKIGEKIGKSVGVSLGTLVPEKGVVIGEKWARESITSSPSKKGKADDGSKGKGVDSGPEGKKKATSSSKAPATPTAASSRPREGVIPPANKEKVEKFTLDQTATKLFHALVLGSSLAVRSRKAGGQASLQKGRVASMEAKANDELAKMKSDRDSLADKLEISGVLVNELREALDKTKESAMEEFKSSSEFMVAVEDSASKYFGGFDFCKVQLCRHHPDLTIDLEGTVVDQDLLAEQDEAAEENEKEKLGENKGG